MVGIYKITNPKGKIYVGQSVNIYQRISKYRVNSVPKQPKIFRSINAHGWDNHIFEIIEECSIEELDDLEAYWKQYYLDKVNGDWSLVLFCDLHDTGGGPKSDIWKQSKSRPILQYDLEGNFIKEWASGKQFAESNGLSGGTFITACLKGRAKTAYKSLWRYKTLNYPHKISPAVLEYEKMKITQYSIDGEFIKEWDSILEAAKTLNIRQQNIVNNLKGRSKSAYNFIWEYKK
jgi:hypothetical protein